ncbi:CoaE-domain-containing protein [Rozella allomycis CSF55]|uniref:CoaE-domain-containing protein n=1 Tax=Rozella allomycis (strain CSF55) TaxID=988480 RepID=A0A075B3N8_ROZAC|nr:Dephospho-CoA kinase domain-containing protein [Rozella allomycis CSF55]RKP20585.1 CoaE-domain-containing protein [Rozella allomycis CSF55]|eukprot:EPZ35498.1 Dephospho-CoA kinase domain-containing protein [Rozella allomycis CSF55]
MYIVGLTGGISSGKSQASLKFQELGIRVIDADLISHKLLQPNSPIYNKIINEFGRDILSDTNEIDRKKLGKIVFDSETKRKILNSIMHPAIKKRIIGDVIFSFITLQRMIVLDIPLLFETGLDAYVNETIVVFCDEETQIERLIHRDRISKEDAMIRLKSQMPLNKKILLADVVFDNSKSINELNDQVVSYVQKRYPSFLRTIMWLISPSTMLFLFFIEKFVMAKHK